MYNPLNNVHAECYQCDEPLTLERHVIGVLGEGEVRPRGYFCSERCYREYTLPENIPAINSAILDECNIIGEARKEMLDEAHGHSDGPQLVYIKHVNLATTSISKEDMGRCNWGMLHSFLSAPLDEWENDEELRMMKNLIESFIHLYPCYECRLHAIENIKKRPPDFSSPRALRQWGCDLHNDVNVMLKKPVLPCVNIQSQIPFRFHCTGHGV